MKAATRSDGRLLISYVPFRVSASFSFLLPALILHCIAYFSAMDEVGRNAA